MLGKMILNTVSICMSKDKSYISNHFHQYHKRAKNNSKEKALRMSFAYIEIGELNYNSDV